MEKNIAILTSGGDSQGMNTVINIVVRVAQKKKINVYGVRRGYRGLVENDMVLLEKKDVENVARMGGTFLKTARFVEFKEEKYQDIAIKNLKDRNISALIVVGGDGSYHGALDLKNKGFNVIAIPGSIDNDLYYTDRTLGFDTAVNNSTLVIEQVKQTMSAMDRCSVLEVMGRYCGDIALYCACANACDVLVIPEKPISEKEIIEKVQTAYNRGNNSPTVIVAEHTYDVKELAKTIQDKTGIETKYCVVGYLQRGGTPSVADRILAMQFGVRAIEMFEKNIFGKAIGVKGNRVIEVDIDQALAVKANFKNDLYDLFNELN